MVNGFLQFVQKIEHIARKEGKTIRTYAGDVVASNIRNTMTTLKINVTQLAAIMNMSRGTIYNRFLNPEEFQVGELERLAKYANKKGLANVTPQSFFVKEVEEDVS